MALSDRIPYQAIVDRPKLAQKLGLPPAITESLFRAASGQQQARP